MDEKYLFTEATEDQLRRLLVILDCLEPLHLRNLMNWVKGGEYYFGNDMAISVLEKEVAGRREIGMC